MSSPFLGGIFLIVYEMKIYFVPEKPKFLYISNFFFNLHQGHAFIDLREREESRGRKRERLPLTCAPTGDQTHNLGMNP